MHETEFFYEESKNRNSDFDSLALHRAKRILIIDDETDVRLTLAELLVNQGYKVATARNGAEGLSYLENLDRMPDLIILDINMPIKDGLEFWHDRMHIPEIADIPIVLMSGDIERRNGAPNEPFIAKPFELPDVINAIEKATAEE